MPGGPKTTKAHFSLLGAIAEGPGGNVFFKLTGPRKTAQKSAAKFAALVPQPLAYVARRFLGRSSGREALLALAPVLWSAR
jgi:hypothetical protein